MTKPSAHKAVRREGGIGLFGGTFNPIHLGHLRGAEEVREAFDLKKIIFIPAALPPHKEAEGVIEPHHRLEMVRIATRSNPCFSASEVELQRPGKSYSIDTVRCFRREGEGALFFIVGKDAFLEIETWKEFQALFALCHVIVMARPGFMNSSSIAPLPKSLASAFRYDPGDACWVHKSGHLLCFKEITFLDISSTRVRELVRRGGSVRYLVPPDVAVYIREHGLYQGSGERRAAGVTG